MRPLLRFRRSAVPFALAAATAVLLAGCMPTASEGGGTSASPQTSEPTTSAPTPSSTPSEEPSPTPSFNVTQYSIDDPESPWVVVNKLRPLDPLDYAPTDPAWPEGIPNEFDQPMQREAAEAVERMASAAAEEGLELRINSATRSYETQVALYDSYVQRDGQAAADTYSARPGHSEHQTGWVADFDDGGGCYLEACFADTELGAWLAKNSWKFGFILRYPDGLTDVTGYQYEPWHFRYVGAELAEEMHRTGVETLEEFFGLDPAPGYADS